MFYKKDIYLYTQYNVMEKIKLKIYEIYNLADELNGSVNQRTGEVISKGLLNEKLSIATKYYLDKLLDNIKVEINTIEKLKEELIKKVGQKDENGGYFVPMRINEKFNDQGEVESFDVNPTFTELQEEINKLMIKECEIEYNPFTLEEITTESEINPRTLFKLI